MSHQQHYTYHRAPGAAGSAMPAVQARTVAPGASVHVGAAGALQSYSGLPAGAPLDTVRRGVKWDEATIAEHDKERGTRTRITEPKTPYRHLRSGEEDDSGLSVTPPESYSAAGRAALQGPWDADGDSMPHDEWDAMTGSSGSPSSASGRRASHTTDDDMMEDDTATRRGHAHFSGASGEDTALHSGFAPLPAAGFVPDPHDAEFDSEAHRQFLARRRQHYSAELPPPANGTTRARSLKEILARGAAHVDADEDEDEDML